MSNKLTNVRRRSRCSVDEATLTGDAGVWTSKARSIISVVGTPYRTASHVGPRRYDARGCSRVGML